MTRVVLASASPRRSAILRQLGIEHETRPAHVDERRRPGEPEEAFVRRMAVEKCSSVARTRHEDLVIGGDTVVSADGRLLGKPRDTEEALATLLALAGKPHRVLTALAVAAPGREPVARLDRATVTMRAFDETEARAYVATGEPMDKAGCYGIQGRGAALVASVEGAYSTVVGLSIPGLVALLASVGWRYTFDGVEPA